LLNAKLPTTDNKHSIWFEKNINNYDLDAAFSIFLVLAARELPEPSSQTKPSQRR
jgi:hypothetical protein